MCTVTFIPADNKIFLTSNRDEKHWRSHAHAPMPVRMDSGQLLYPKDSHAGGTWIAGHENGNAIVFLNGGFIAHEPRTDYRKSRGLILLDLIDSETPYNSFLAINLSNIEPFTAVIWDDGHLFECRWDGMMKHHALLPSEKPAIWSSVTLYDKEVARKREQWFSDWLNNNETIDVGKIVGFHQFTGDGDKTNDLTMHREGKVRTVSITCLSISESSLQMEYLDLCDQKKFFSELVFEKTLAAR